MVNPVALEDLDNKVAEVFGELDDEYYIPACLSDLEKAFEGLSLPWMKFCVEALFVQQATERARKKNASQT